MPSKRELDKENMFRKIMPSSAPQEADGSSGDTEPTDQGAPTQDAPPPVVPESPTPAGDGGKLSDDAIAALFAQQTDAEPEPQPVAEPAPAPAGDGGKLSDDAIAALFAQQTDAEPEPQPVAEPTPAPAGDGGKLSDDAIAALFAQQTDAEPEPQPAPESTPAPAGDSGKLSDDAIAALFAQQPAAEEVPVQPEPQPVPEPAPAPAGDGGKLSDDAIAALFAQQTDAEPEPQPVPEPTPAPAGDGGKLSDDAIAALFAQQPAAEEAPKQPEPQPAPEPTPAPAGGGKLSDDAIAALFAQQPEPAAEEAPAQPEPQPEAEAEPSISPKLDIAAMYAQQHAKTLAEMEETGISTQQQEEGEFGDEIDVALEAFEPAAPEQAPPVFVEAEPLPQPPATTAEYYENPPYLINLSQALAEQCYERYRQRLGGCKCAKCRDDALGMALNRIKPHYITSDQMDTALLRERALLTECVTALIHAIFVVKRSPKHDLADAMNQ